VANPRLQALSPAERIIANAPPTIRSELEAVGDTHLAERVGLVSPVGAGGGEGLVSVN
jgi:hypothetical protein